MANIPVVVVFVCLFLLFFLLSSFNRYQNVFLLLAPEICVDILFIPLFSYHFEFYLAYAVV